MKKQTKFEIKKELENLYSWSQFYAANQLWENYDKAQKQIEEFKYKHQIA